MRSFLQVDPWICIFAALLILTVPLVWILSAIFAAAFHELCHIGAIKALGGRVLSLRIGVGGAMIDTEVSGKGKELLCAIAGPAGSLFLLAFCHAAPMLAICAGIQGLFNLLPVYPLDGGRILQCGLELICPSKADVILHWTEMILYFVLLILLFIGTYVFSMGIFPLLVLISLIIKAVLRKRPCKQRQIRVQ